MSQTEVKDADSKSQGDGTGRSRSAGLLSARQLERFAVPGVLVALVVLFSLFIPTFRTLGNIQTMINSQSVILLLAITAIVTLRINSFDLSIAAVMVASASTVAVLTTSGFGIAVSVAAGIALGMVVGFIQAYIVVKIGVDSFIVTLGMLTALAGVTYAITSSRIVTGLPQPIIDFAREKVLGIPLATWYSWIAVGIAWFVFERTPLGRHMLFIGGNINAARLAGIPVDRIRFGASVMSSTLAALVGLVLVGQLGAIDPSIGSQYVLPPFAAAFLGSTAFTPGRFNALGTAVAVYLLVVGITGLQLIGVASWISSLFNGLALVLAVTLARLAGNRR
jgi:ribose transport system permease protein